MGIPNKGVRSTAADVVACGMIRSRKSLAHSLTESLLALVISSLLGCVLFICFLIVFCYFFVESNRLKYCKVDVEVDLTFKLTSTDVEVDLMFKLT